ncbi:MAG: hypothetical protein RLZZ584_216 [Pseudomonadota bacterium]|jgi:uncharacterized protein (UPF0276 family)
MPSLTLAPPWGAGIGWRHPHYRELLELRPTLGFIEVHSENFFADGGASLALLRQAREHYALGLHGVGLSLGSAAPLDDWHVQHLARLVRQMQPWLVSEHAAYARGRPPGRGGAVLHANDLLPIPFSRAALQTLADHVDEVQVALGRAIAIENVSAYLVPPGGEELAEPEVEAGFLRELSERSGCLLLVDVNNLVVNALNRRSHGGSDVVDLLAHCERWLDQLPGERVAEIHVAGHDASGPVVIDHHGATVPELVWQVYRAAIARYGAVPTLVERDNHIPPLAELLAEAARADAEAAAALAQRHRPGRATGPGACALPGEPRPVAQLAPQELLRLAHGQGELLGWIRGAGAPAAALSTGLAVYRNNARGLARRCLGAVYPVLHELLGPAVSAALAQRYWHDEPPTRGDLADWGASLADWLRAQPDACAAGLLADAPYLPDIARLEWALYRAELAADEPADDLADGDGDRDDCVDDHGAGRGEDRPGRPAGAASDLPDLALLGQADPADLVLRLAPACQLLASPYPVAAIWQAHRDEGDDTTVPGADLMPGALPGPDEAAAPTTTDTGAQMAVRQRQARLGARLQAIAAAWSADAGACRVLIWRPRWRARLREVDVAEQAFVQAVLAGASLAAALDAGLAARPPLDFGRWLVQALQTGLLRGVVHRPG